MHHMQKKAAVKKYGPLLIEENGEQKISDAMKADQFTDEEISEVIIEIKSQPNEGDQAGPYSPSATVTSVVTIKPENGIAPDPVDTKPKTLNKVYEEFRVAPEYKEVKDAMGNILGNKLTGFRKLDVKPVKETSIHPDKAEELNSQSINTGLHLFLKQ